MRLLPGWRGSKALLSQVLRGHVLTAFGFEATLPSADRRLLESTILPQLGARADTWRVTFVRTACYTKPYANFFEGKEDLRHDRVTQHARFGARTRHIVDRLENVGAHFKPSTLDLVVCNGVFGWGLDDRHDVERAFDGIFECSRPGGLFVLGWDDVPEHRPFRPEATAAVQRFAPYYFEPLAGTRYAFRDDDAKVDASGCRHVFDFYQKPPPSQ